jgi:hypothetical protein
VLAAALLGPVPVVFEPGAGVGVGLGLGRFTIDL